MKSLEIANCSKSAMKFLFPSEGNSEFVGNFGEFAESGHVA